MTAFKPTPSSNLHRVHAGERRQALTSAQFRHAILGRPRDRVEPREGGAFFLRYPEPGACIMIRPRWSNGTALAPLLLESTWLVEGMPEFRELPECLQA